jgi:subtilisin family serine protease
MTFEMNKGMIPGITVGAWLVCGLLSIFLATLPVYARDGSAAHGKTKGYIIVLQDPPLATYEGQVLSVADRSGGERLRATSARATGKRRLDTRSREAKTYLKFIADRHEEFEQEVSLLLGRKIKPVHQYSVVANGLAINISPAEAEILAQSPLVKSISKDTRHRLQTYAGPEWIGAGELWSGDAGFTEARGEGIIIASIDSGINWDHPSFSNPSTDGYTHTNPLGHYLGLCNDPGSGAQCNGKLIGVYDFVEDDPDTTDVVEENTNGKDNDGHGSHTASTAAGNRINTFLEGKLNVTLSGVAPRANIVAYRVCYTGEPAGSDTGACMESAILSAIDQAVMDEVDVINYSIGSDATNPWSAGSFARAFLNARDAGVFVATSAGNDGPDGGTIGSPGNAPWLVAAGAATHNTIIGSVVGDLAGGATPPPGNMIGASLTNGIAQRTIVHARDYGYALCGVGDDESETSCEDNSGFSNPWDGQKPFNGEIVVCDRGTYGRVEKGKNLMLAGAGGYILANVDDWGEDVRADEHCLPAAHLGKKDADELSAWLVSGSGHKGSISGFGLVESDEKADQVADYSSRGPSPPPVANTLKPNVIAPGGGVVARPDVGILAASSFGQALVRFNGTSMASPHVAGAAALLLSIHPNWNVSQVVSAIETTATAELATDQGISPATPHERGAGRVQLGEAANAGLYLNVTTSEFLNANPATGGQPRNLNLSGLVDSGCQATCSFTRTVTDQKGGGSWTATASGFPEGVSVVVSPRNFSLGNRSSRSLKIDIDLTASGIVGDWVSGVIRLSANGSSDQFLTVSAYSDAGDLPGGWSLTDDRNGGWHVFNLSGLVALPDATFTAVGLVRPVAETLVEDPTYDDPYDGGQGVFTTWHSLPQGGSWLYAETLASTAEDVDLFVGRDDNGNGIAEESEQLCASRLETDLVQCNLYDLPPGNYWILVQNWLASKPAGDVVTLVHAAVDPAVDSRFSASGPGMAGAGEVLPVRLSWDNLDALPGEQLYGAVGVSTDRATPNNVGVIPVRFNRSGIVSAETFPLINGMTHHLALGASVPHDRMFIDVPAGASSLTVFAGGADAAQSDGLTLELKRMDFDAGISVPPFATPAGNQPVIVSAHGVGGAGPSITVFGVEPGRWYAVLTNSSGSPSAVSIRADVAFQGQGIQAQLGLWEPNSRLGLAQGYEFNQGGNSRALIWYTYDEAGQPAWYIANNAVSSGNIWTADLLRVTNDGARQHFVRVGNVVVAILGEKDAMFSYTLFGQSGTERMQPLSSLTCPEINGSEKNYTGLWYRGVDGLGGASVLVNAVTQAQIHYLFDATGAPRWLFAQDLENPEPTNSTLPILQIKGYCAVCQASAISTQTVGILERSFASETMGSWSLDYLFQAPLMGSVQRTDSIVMLTDVLNCQ